MANFNLEDYVPVSDRILDFWEKYPNGRITTNLVDLDGPGNKQRMAVFQAHVFADKDDVNPIATGWAKEREGTAGANRTAFLENAETSAIGRALANLGFAVERGKPGTRPSREEIQSVVDNENTLEDILGRIKVLGIQSGDTELQNEIRQKWSNLRNDLVSASGFLVELEERLGVGLE